MVRSVVACVVMLFAVSVAGCIGGGGWPLDEDTPQAGSSVDGDAAGNLTAFRFSDRAAGTLTLWANGTVPAVHDCPLNCYTNATEVTSLVPGHVPAMIVAVLRWEDPPFARGFSEIRTGPEAVRFLSSGGDEGDSYHLALILLRRDATVEVVASHGADRDSGGAYSLEITVSWDPTVVSHAVPVAFDAAPGRPIRLSGDGDGVVEAVVYGAGGAPVARFSARGPVDFEAAMAGRFVLMPEWEGTNLTIYANGSDAPGRLVPMRFESTFAAEEPYAATRLTPVSWTFTVDEVPVRVGAAAVFPRTVEAAPVRPHFLIESPAGVVVDRALECGTVCYVFGIASFSADSGRGHEGLVAGEYTVTYTPRVGEAGLVYHFVERIVAV